MLLCCLGLQLGLPGRAAVVQDHAVAYKLLERVFVTVGREDVGDKWTNVKYQGKAFNINDWRVGKQVGSKR